MLLESWAKVTFTPVTLTISQTGRRGLPKTKHPPSSFALIVSFVTNYCYQKKRLRRCHVSWTSHISTSCIFTGHIAIHGHICHACHVSLWCTHILCVYGVRSKPKENQNFGSYYLDSSNLQKMRIQTFYR